MFFSQFRKDLSYFKSEDPSLKLASIPTGNVFLPFIVYRLLVQINVKSSHSSQEIHMDTGQLTTMSRNYSLSGRSLWQNEWCTKRYLSRLTYSVVVKFFSGHLRTRFITFLIASSSTSRTFSSSNAFSSLFTAIDGKYAPSLSTSVKIIYPSSH